MTSSSPAPDSEGVASMESLGRTECLNLLATAQVGRVALVVDGHPEILPVNYALDGDTRAVPHFRGQRPQPRGI
jgi:nitroimidazol reductase NimA-like FMN-containing flavoprotein (pyridoxamine 5'-phosphate oxidase superfamily)